MGRFCLIRFLIPATTASGVGYRRRFRPNSRHIFTGSIPAARNALPQEPK